MILTRVSTSQAREGSIHCGMKRYIPLLQILNLVSHASGFVLISTPLCEKVFEPCDHVLIRQ